MSARILTEINLEFESAVSEAGSAGQDALLYAEASILLALAHNKRKAYGADFTPPPFQSQLITQLEAAASAGNSKTPILQVGTSVIQFEVESVAALVETLRTVRWTDTIPFRLDSRPLHSLPLPVMQYRLGFKSPLRWFEEHISECDLLCYLGTGPCYGVHVKSASITFQEVWEIVYSMCERLGLTLNKIQGKAFG